MAGKSGNTAPSASSGLTASTPARSPNSPPIFLTSIYRSLFFLVFSASSAHSFRNKGPQSCPSPGRKKRRWKSPSGHPSFSCAPFAFRFSRHPPPFFFPALLPLPPSRHPPRPAHSSRPPHALRALPRAPALCARACRPLRQKATCFSRPHLPSPQPGGPSPPAACALPRLPHGPRRLTPRYRRPHIPPSCSMSASTPTARLQFFPAGMRTRAARYTVERC